MLPGWVDGAMHTLDFQGAVEGLGPGIVITGSGPAEGPSNTKSAGGVGELLGRVLATSVAVKPTSA